MRIGLTAPLDAGQLVVQALGDGADLTAAEGDLLIASGQLADGGDDGGGAGAPALFQSAVLGGLKQLLGGDAALLHLVAPVAQKLDAGTAGDAGQNGAVQVGGEDLAAHLEHDIHGAYFFDILAVHAVQPQDLRVAALLGPVARAQGGGVVAAGLGHAGAALDGADILVLDVNLDGVQALGIIGTHGADDHDVLHMVGRMHAQSGVQTDHEGTDIQGGVLLIGDPVLLQLDQLHDTGQSQLVGDIGHTQTVSGVVQTLDIAVGTEQLDGAVGGAVSLHALENFLAVMQDLGSGVDLQRTVGDDAGIVPALTLVIVHDEHMIGHVLAEYQSGSFGLFLQSGGTGDLDLLHSECLLIIDSYSKYCKVLLL